MPELTRFLSSRPCIHLHIPSRSSCHALMHSFIHLSRGFLLHPLPAPFLSSVPAFPNALSAGLCPVLAPGQAG